jgi:hypothetical protein
VTSLVGPHREYRIIALLSGQRQLIKLAVGGDTSRQITACRAVILEWGVCRRQECFLSDPDLLLVLHVLSFHVLIIAYSSHFVLWPHQNHKPIISIFMRFALFFTRPIIFGKIVL